MNYRPILNQLTYWKNYTGTGDAYRKNHDRDCILTGGNLFSDTIISLWLPLRYTLNEFDKPRWKYWKAYEMEVLKKRNTNLKNCKEFLEDIENNIEMFLPENELTAKLIKLFEIGQKRSNIMILPERQWNMIRGKAPYFDYLPHFLFDKLSIEDVSYQKTIVKWIEREKLTGFFKEGIIDKEHLLDLAGTGCVCNHRPSKISLSLLLENYIMLLKHRESLMNFET